MRFREMIEAMSRDGVTRFIEVGPGRVLTGLVDQILDASRISRWRLTTRRPGVCAAGIAGLAALAADGVALDLAALFDSYETPQKHVPAPKHAVMVSGANLGKPYPPADGKTSVTPKRARAAVVCLAPATGGRTKAPGLRPISRRSTICRPCLRRNPAVRRMSGVVVDRIQKETAEQHQRLPGHHDAKPPGVPGQCLQMAAQINGQHITVSRTHPVVNEVRPSTRSNAPLLARQRRSTDRPADRGGHAACLPRPESGRGRRIGAVAVGGRGGVGDGVAEDGLSG